MVFKSFFIILVLMGICRINDAYANAGHSIFRLDMAYTGDIMSNISGGLETGTRYLDNLDLVLEVDGEQAIGWDGATFMVYGLYNNGARFSDTIVGDAQVVSNIETGVKAVRLYEAWIDQKLADDRASVRFGLYDLNSEFDAIETAGLFINSAQGIGTDFGQTGMNGPSIFPYTSLALRVDFAPSDNWIIRVAALDGIPGDMYSPKRTVIKLSDEDGLLLVGELNYHTGPLRLGIGYWNYTGKFEKLTTGEIHHHNRGVYGFMEGRVYSDPVASDRGLDVFWRIGQADSASNFFKRYYGFGAVYHGPLASRPYDSFGIAIATAETGLPYRLTEGAEDREMVLEMTYRAELHPNVIIQPDMQYVINPSANPALQNAFVLGLRFELKWGGMF